MYFFILYKVIYLIWCFLKIVFFVENKLKLCLFIGVLFVCSGNIMLMFLICCLNGNYVLI